MAVLSATDRFRACAQFIRDLGDMGCSKAQIKAAADATDDWIDSNSTSFNNALPAAFRNTATLAQKTLLFCYVAMRRAGILRAQED